MRAFFFLGVCLGLAGCAGEPALNLFGAGQSSGVSSLGLRAGAVEAQGPDGYCADRSVSRPEDGFAVFASCRRVTGSGPAISLDGLVTVQVGTSGTASVTGSEDALAAVLGSDRGRALLATEETAGTVEVGAVETTAGLVAVRFQDDTASVPEGLGPVIWRAFLDIEGRLVTVTARAFDTAPMSADRQRRLLDLTLANLRGANAAEAG